MDERSSKFSKNVLHVIPGYTGYCPQLKFHIGKSYGKLTSQLLKETHSGRLQVLSAETSTSLPSILGNDSYRIVPGYTGFIPRCEEYIGCTYSTMCQKALTEFHQETQERIRRRSLNLPLVGSQHIDRPKPPVKAICSTVPCYESLNTFIPGKPYHMDEDDPQKYIITGFTGHVPKSHFLSG
ncbi:protein FAM166B [Nematolebias whitei]|uniref:protein FAM166B n=1 Tax=Nematolebias whitei TaxID=451745 RepID=UPI0018984A6D|nr:protein FAM166B [Nematolebias whitei]